MKNIFCGLALFLSAFVGLAAAPTVLQNGAVVSNGLRVATGVITGNASGVSNIPGNKVNLTTGGGITAFTNPSGQVQFYIDPAILSNGVNSGIGAINPNQFSTNASVLALLDGGRVPPMDGASLTNMNWVSPMDFLAVGDGTTDDTAALSNAVARLNSGHANVLDLGGRTYKIATGWTGKTNSPLGRITRNNATIQNGTILYNSTNGVCFAKPIGTITSDLANNFNVSHVTFRQIVGKPDPENIALQFGDRGGPAPYGINCVASFCNFSNWWRPVQIVGVAQSTIINSTFRYCWSNAIHIAVGDAGADMVRIEYNSFDENDLPWHGEVETNQIKIQADMPTYAIEVIGNQLGACKQAMLIHPGVVNDVFNVRLVDNSVGAFYMSDPTISPFEIWNPSSGFTVDNMRVAATPPSSNYHALFGLYATNSIGRLNMSTWKIGQVDRPWFDVWSTNELDMPVIDSIPISPNNDTRWVRHLAQQKDTAGTVSNYWAYGNQIIHPGTNETLLAYGPSLKIQGANTVWGTIADSGSLLTVNGSITLGAATTFTAGSSANVFGLNSSFSKIKNNGGITYLDIDASLASVNRWRMLSLNSTTPDLEGSNNVLYAYAPFHPIGGIVDLRLNAPFMTNATAMSNLTVDATLNIRAISNTNSSPSIHFLNSNAVINATITASAASLTFAGSQPAALFQMSVFAPNLVAGFLYGNGAGLTALPATQLVGLVPLANLPPVVVTNGFGYTPLVINNTLTVNSNVTVNGTMSASNMVFDTASFSTAVATNFYFYTNATSAWPTAPPAYGAAYVGNSNGVLYILTSFHNADGGYPTNIWTKTNLWAPQ